jgi:hypothetical protein
MPQSSSQKPKTDWNPLQKHSLPCFSHAPEPIFTGKRNGIGYRFVVLRTGCLDLPNADILDHQDQ